MQRPSLELVEQMTREAMREGAWTEVTRLARLLDEYDAQRRTASLAGAALWYAKQGLLVFPIQPRIKEPYARSHGCLDATSDVEQVAAWWRAAPNSNIGIATGHLVDVIDIDGYRGNVSLLRLLDESPHALDACLGKVFTPRAGGRHFYMPATGLGNGAALALGIDYRGKGGYVLAPPSVTDIGVYRWTTALDVDAARQASA